MTIKEKLSELKDIEDKNQAIDAAFVAGVQSVTPLREFTYSELQVLLEEIRTRANEITLTDRTRPIKQILYVAAEKISAEITRRGEPLRDRQSG